MKQSGLSLPSVVAALVATLLLAACETVTQGPVQTPAAGTALGPASAKEIEPAPVSKSYPKKEAFQGAEYDPGIAAAYPNAKQLRLRVGEVIEVFRGSWQPGDGQIEMAFYLPPEATSVVQLVVETKGFAKTYFLKGIGRGDTVGGVVERRWLDFGGYRAKDAAAESRIQTAIKTQPYLISVE